MLRIFRNVVFVGWLALVLGATTLAAGIWAVQLTGQVASLTAQAAVQATQLATTRARAAQLQREVAASKARHRRDLARVKARTKARARVRRAIVAVPVAGLVAVGVFEEQDFREWARENPGGTRTDYACATARYTADVIEQELLLLPELVRPDPGSLAGLLPDCTE